MGSRVEIVGQPCLMLRKRFTVILKGYSVGYLAELFLKILMLYVSQLALTTK